MVSVSLGTRAPEQAKRLARARRTELDKAFAALEQAARPDDDLRGTVLHLSDADIDSVCERYRAKMLTEDELQRIKGFKPTEHELDVDILEAGLPDLRLAPAPCTACRSRRRFGVRSENQPRLFAKGCAVEGCGVTLKRRA